MSKKKTSAPKNTTRTRRKATGPRLLPPLGIPAVDSLGPVPGLLVTSNADFVRREFVASAVIGMLRSNIDARIVVYADGQALDGIAADLSRIGLVGWEWSVLLLDPAIRGAVSADVHIALEVRAPSSDTPTIHVIDKPKDTAAPYRDPRESARRLAAHSRFGLRRGVPALLLSANGTERSEKLVPLHVFDGDGFLVASRYLSRDKRRGEITESRLNYPLPEAMAAYSDRMFGKDRRRAALLPKRRPSTNTAAH